MVQWTYNLVSEDVVHHFDTDIRVSTHFVNLRLKINESREREHVNSARASATKFYPNKCCYVRII